MSVSHGNPNPPVRLSFFLSAGQHSLPKWITLNALFFYVHRTPSTRCQSCSNFAPQSLVLLLCTWQTLNATSVSLLLLPNTETEEQSLLGYSNRFCLLTLPTEIHAGKGKVRPCTGTEVLYRPYGPQGEQRYSCTVQTLRLCTGHTAHRGSRGIAVLYRH